MPLSLPVVSNQSYGDRRDYPPMSPKDASTVLGIEFEGFSEVALNYLEAGDDKTPAPVLAVRAPASLGKTTQLLEQIRVWVEMGHRVGFFGISLELIDEVKIKAVEMGIPARVFRGRSALREGQPSDGLKMCAKSKLAESLSAAGYSIADTLCASRLPTGKRDDDGKMEYEKVECPFATECPYMSQMKDNSPGLILGSHAYLHTPIEALRQEARVDILVVDESFANEATVKNRKVVLTDMFSARSIPTFAGRYKKEDTRKAKDEAIFEDMAEFEIAGSIMRNALLRAKIEKRQLLIEDVFAAYEKMEMAQSASDFFRHLSNLEYARLVKPEIHAGMPDELQAELASKILSRDCLAFAATWKRLAMELERRSSGPFNGITFAWDAIDTKGFRIYDEGRLFYPKEVKYDKVPVIIIDASASDQIINQFYPNFEFVTMKVALPSTVKICQVADRTGSMRMYKEARERTNEVYAFIQRIAIWTQLETSHLSDGKDRRPLFIGYKSLHEEKWLEERKATSRRNEKGENIVEFVNCAASIAHSNGVRGVDRWKHCRALVIASRMEPHPSAVEELTRAIFANVDRPLLTGVSSYVPEERELKAKNGSFASINVSRHPDPLCDLVLRQIREEEIIQGMTRSRPIHRDEPLTIFVLTNIPLGDYEPDSLFNWADVMPDAFDRFRLDPANEVIPDRLSDLHQVSGDTWPSYAAMRMAHPRRKPTEWNLLSQFSGTFVNATKPLLNYLYKRSVALADHAEIPPISAGLILGQDEVRVEFRRSGGRGIRTAIVKFNPGETASHLESKMLRAFPDAYDIKLIGTLPEIAATEANLVIESKHLEDLASDAAASNDNFYWDFQEEEKQSRYPSIKLHQLKMPTPSELRLAG